ncbi:hypothetical protein BRYFOR_05446 [Marvinbryantia formatexigens DSM 14469]|uniref:SpaA-like prealbumin fold domain-containing protein n=2 Tax=Marvinbryantia TaxID=248744 RepID=C6LA05_9FIRM|nr:hypothetical protein BRYFOR_05446 [Marvinbryantia formatexigens DSM 14469]
MGLPVPAADGYGESRAPDMMAGTAEETEAETEDMTYYTVTLPYYDGCSYDFDEERVQETGEEDETAGYRKDNPEEKQDTVLRYRAEEAVEILIKPADGLKLSEAYVRSSEDRGSSHAYTMTDAPENTYRMEFTMPEEDIRLELVFGEKEQEEETQVPSETYQMETDQTGDTLQEPGTEPLQEDADAQGEETDEWTETEQTGQMDAVQTDAVPVETEAETDTDGLPLQGSIVQMSSVTIPYDTWDFDPYSDFRGITYDGDQFSIEFISDNVIYDEAGVYDCIYRVKDNGSGKIWFVLRPVVVSEEGIFIPETVTEVETEPQTETASEPETELQTETVSEPETELQTETVFEPETELQTETVSEPETELQTETVSEPETEPQTEEASEPETEPQTEAESETETQTETEPFMREVKIVKKDLYTGSPLAGAQFRILDGDGKVLLMKDNQNDGELTDTVTTDDKGEILLPEPLEEGRYTLEEVKAPEGYLLSEALEFSVSNDGDEGEQLEVESTGKPQTGSISIHVTDGEGAAAGEGFSFEISVAEDITDPAGIIRTMDTADGTVELRKGTVAAVISTGTDGTAVAENLYPGSYCYTETASADCYAADTELYTVELPGRESASEMRKDVTVVNRKTFFELYKVDVEADGNGDVPLAGVSFCIFTSEGMEEEKAARAEAVIGELQGTGMDNIQHRQELLDELTAMEPGRVCTTDENGRISISDFRHDAVYYFYETAAMPGYNRDTGIYQFEVDALGLVSGNAGYSVKLSGTANLLDIQKTDAAGQNVLAGAALQLEDEAGNLVEAWTSAEEPHRIRGLSAGTYTLSETRAPEGYALAEDITFTLTDSLEIRRIVMKDELLTVSFRKLDESGKTAVAGARLAVLDESGEKLAEWVTDQEAYRLNLPAGSYRLEELEAPEGYAKAETVSFEVKPDKALLEVTMYGRLIQAAVSKQDITDNKELPGARLILRDTEGTEIDEWVSTEEPRVMNLAAGKYVLVEETAPEGYELAEKLEFEVTDSMELQTFVMYDTPKEKKINLTGKTHNETKTTGGSTAAAGGNPAAQGGTATGTAVRAAGAQTGDFNRYLPAVIIILAGAAGLAAAAVLHRKNRKH